MAKQRDDSTEIKKLLADLYKIVQTTNASSQEQIRINRELLKVMTLLESGFAKNEEDARKLIDDIHDGLEIQDEYAVKWAKHRKAEQKDIDKILKKFRELEQVQEDEIENAEDYLDLLSDRYDLVGNELDITKSLLSSQKDILKIVKDNKRVYNQIGGSAISIDDTLSKIVKKKMDFSGMFSDTYANIENTEILIKKINDDITTLIHNASSNIIDFPFHFNPLTGDLDNEIKKIMESVQIEKNERLTGLTQYFEKNKKMQTDIARKYASEFSGLDIKVDVDTGEIYDGVKLLTAGTKDYEKVVKRLDKIIEKNGIGEQLQQNISEIIKLVDLGANKTAEQQKKLQDLLKPMGIATSILTEQIDLKLKDMDIYNASMIKESAKIKLLTKNLDLLQLTERTVKRIGNGFDYISAALPLGLGDLLGFTNASNVLLDDHKKGIDAMVESLSNGASRASALKSYFSAMKPALGALLNPITIIVTSTALLYKLVSGITSKYKDMNFEMKTSLLQSSQLLSKNLDILTSQQNQFSTLKDIELIQTELIGSSGKFYSAINKGNDQIILSISELGKVFGYGASEAAKIHKTFTDLGANDNFAVNLQTNLGLISEMVGLSPQIIGQDLLDSAEIVFTYFAGMPQKAAEAALGVRRLGMSLKQAGSIAQKMLNLEGFMTDMYELNAMSGKTIDFSKAFDLGVMGDIEGMTKEIMNNIGDTARFNSMDYLTRMKIANTLGMSMDELSKSVKMHEQMSQFSGEEYAALEQNIDRMGDISKLNKDQIQQRLQQLQSTDRLSVAWDKIKGVLIKSVLPLVEAFADAISAISPLIDVIIGSLRIVGAILKPIFAIVKGMVLPFKFVGDAISKVNTLLFGSAQSVDSITDKFKGLEPILKTIGGIIGTFYLGKGVIGGFTKLTGIGGQLLSILPMIGNIFKSKIPSDIDVTEKKMKQVKDGSNGLFTGIGSSAEAGFKTVKDIATKTFSFMLVHQAQLALGFGKNIEDGIKDNQSGIESAFNGSFAMGSLILSQYLERGISKVFEKKLEKNFEKGIDPIKDKAKNVFDVISNYGKKAFPKTFSMLEKGLDKIKPQIDQTITTEDVSKNITETVKKVKNVHETNTKQVAPEIIETKKVDVKGVDKSKDNISIIDKLFTNLSKTIQTVWKLIKDTLMDIVNFVSDVARSLSKGLGDSIKNILNGISEGLNKFTTNAVKGAASLLIVSGALWVTSKALQNFANVSWNDVTKGLITLTTLAATGQLLGKMSGNLITASIAIALLGASLIPAAYALNKFNDVDWSSLGKATLAIVGLGVIGSVLGPLLPVMAAAAAGIALLGASIIPLAYGLQMFNNVEWSSIGKGITALVGFSAVGTVLGLVSPLLISASFAITTLSASTIVLTGSLSFLNTILNNLNISNVKYLTENLISLTNISYTNLFGIAGGIMAISSALVMLSAGNIFSSISKGFSSVFGDSLSGIAKLADPIKIVSDSLIIITDLVERLNNVISDLDFSKLSDNINLDIFKKIKVLNDTETNSKITYDTNYKPIKQVPVQPLPPTKSATAQNVNVNKTYEKRVELETQKNVELQREMEDNTDSLNEISTKRLEQLMQQMVQLMQIQVSNNQIPSVELNGYTVGKILKKYNNG